MLLPLFISHKECKRCDLHTHVKSVGMPARRVHYSLVSSQDTPAILIVGQNPGQREDEAGECFVGPTGRLLHAAYIGQRVEKPGHPLDGTEVGAGLWKRATIFLSNVARCGTWSGLEPSNSQYALCAPYLLEDIRLILPTCSRLILLLCGAPAIFHTYKALTGTGMKAKQAFDTSGEYLPFHDTSIQIFSTYHPAFVIRKNAMLEAVINHLQLLLDSLDGISATPSSPHLIPPCYPSSIIRGL